MWYEINVSLDGEHLFATHKRSLTTKSQALKVWRSLRHAYERVEGIEITVTEWEATGTEVDPANEWKPKE